MPVATCHIWALQATLSQWLTGAGRAPRPESKAQEDTQMLLGEQGWHLRLSAEAFTHVQHPEQRRESEQGCDLWDAVPG